jgi:hypothetical protein
MTPVFIETPRVANKYKDNASAFAVTWRKEMDYKKRY